MINHIEVASRSRENVTHTLYMDEQGKAIGCSCERRQYHPNVDCGHMIAWNSKQQRKDDERTAYNNYCLSMGI